MSNSTKYVLAQSYAGAQFWNADKSDLVEVRRSPGQPSPEIPSEIPDGERDRLLKLGAIVEADKADEAPALGGAPEEPAGNASKTEWAAYADALGLTVEPNLGRDEIKQLIAASRG